jgi:hypothetical protein
VVAQWFTFGEIACLLEGRLRCTEGKFWKEKNPSRFLEMGSIYYVNNKSWFYYAKECGRLHKDGMIA